MGKRRQSKVRSGICRPVRDETDRGVLGMLEACTRYNRGKTPASLSGVAGRAKQVKAVLFVGRGIDALSSYLGKKPGRTPRPIGYALTDEERAARLVGSDRIIDEVLRLRGKQIGPDRAGATITLAEGAFEGVREKSLTIEIQMDKDVEATETDFEWRMAKLAEELALATAQKEIRVEYHLSKGVFYRSITPKGLPPPGGKLDRLLR